MRSKVLAIVAAGLLVAVSVMPVMAAPRQEARICARIRAELTHVAPNSIAYRLLVRLAKQNGCTIRLPGGR